MKVNKDKLETYCMFLEVWISDVECYLSELQESVEYQIENIMSALSGVSDEYTRIKHIISTLEDVPFEEPQRLMDQKEVLELIPISKSSLWRHIKDGKFPEPKKVGSRTFWDSQQVMGFIDALKNNHGLDVGHGEKE